MGAGGGKDCGGHGAGGFIGPRGHVWKNYSWMGKWIEYPCGWILLPIDN